MGKCRPIGQPVYYVIHEGWYSDRACARYPAPVVYSGQIASIRFDKNRDVEDYEIDRGPGRQRYVFPRFVFDSEEQALAYVDSWRPNAE